MTVADPAGRCRHRRRRRPPACSSARRRRRRRTTTIVQQAPLGSASPASDVARTRADRARHLQARRARRRVHPRAVVQQRSRRSTSSRRQQENVATGSGFVIDDDGPHPHQRPRRRRRDSTSASRSPTAARSPREVVGKDADTDLALLKVNPKEAGPAPAAARRLPRRPGRRPDGRDRQPVRARPHAHDRRRLRAAAPDHGARRLRDRGRHPDRRGDQPRQLRRPAARRRRARDRRSTRRSPPARGSTATSGIGFAVPVDTAKERRSRSSSATGRVEPPFLGVTRRRVDGARRRWSRPCQPGALVRAVAPAVRRRRPRRRSTSATAAIVVLGGDVITAHRRREVQTMDDVHARRSASHKPGDRGHGRAHARRQAARRSTRRSSASARAAPLGRRSAAPTMSGVTRVKICGITRPRGRRARRRASAPGRSA